MRLLGDLARLNGRRFGAKTALYFEDETLSFAELDACADGIGRRLIDAGVGPGDHVALLAENCLEFFPTYFGIVKVGAAMVPLNYRCTIAELEHMLRDSRPTLLLHTPAYADPARALAERLPGAFATMVLGPDLLDRHAPPLPPLPADFSEMATAALMYTSGTTGRPKGAMLPHRALIEQAANTALATGTRHDDRMVVTVPLFHGGGMFVVSHPHLYVGASIVLSARFQPDELVGLIERHEATSFFGVPAQYAILLDRTKAPGALGRLSKAWYGAAPMPVELVRRSQALWPGVEFQQCYGQTETTVTTVLAPEDHDRKLGTAGRELPGVELRIVDDRGDECPVGTVGEVIVNKEAGMTGYYNNPAQTAQTIRGDWVYTGDLGFLDEDGFLTLVDRKRDMIVSGGENVYPKEIEEVLYACEGVVEAAVIGVEDARWGEVPVGFVVVSRSGALDAAALQAWCEDRLARYKVPRRWELVDELPKTANGKIRKQTLRDTLRTPD